MGLRHLRGFAALRNRGVPGPFLAAICDSDLVRRTEAVALYRELTGDTVPAVASMSELESVPGVAGVDVAVPTALHLPLALEAFDRGLHVLVEKPIALTVRSATLMTEAAKGAGLVLAVAENFRRVPGNRAFRSLIRDGEIGTPYFTLSTLSIPSAMLHPTGGGAWYRDQSMAGSLVALEMGVHEMDLLQYWFGPARTVDATVRTYEPEIVGDDGSVTHVTSEDTCLARVDFDDKLSAQVTLTMAGHGEPVGSRFVVGSRGSVSSACWEGWQDGWFTPDDGERVPVEATIAAWVDGLSAQERELWLPEGTWDPAALTLDITDPVRYGVAYEIFDFARAVDSGTSPEVGGPEGTADLAAAIALLESSLAGGPVSVADVADGTVTAWQDPLDERLHDAHLI
ncbi:gfo/Idh/MocA family oxidoreductase [Nocardioides marmoriginsengisoli]|uniref:Gfo/Idh/MocA family oxidoreductase n=2 Tax=Nocardioides marmoriginsengisoli TaxID=661483 RepID=A0A3N0CEN5_9ACTN|nr:gfo/Idh/MocA family oxidoreductase [Nocardioides marmoriginsengisoli]